MLALPDGTETCFLQSTDSTLVIDAGNLRQD
jgi:hypothetical protein